MLSMTNKHLRGEVALLQVPLHCRAEDFVDPLNEEETGHPHLSIGMPHHKEASLVDFATLEGPWSL